MKFSYFGRERERLSVLGLGCSRIGSLGNPAPFSDIRRTVELATELGINVFDTADIYGQGDSERALGILLKAKRQQSFIVSKIGKRFSWKMRALQPFKPVLRKLIARSSEARSAISARRSDNMRADFTPAYLEKALHRSLRRLGLETLDALLLHSPSAEQLGFGDIEPRLMRFRRDGKIRYYGVSCDDAASLAAALKFEELSLLELPVDLIEASRATALWRSIAERQIGIIAREAIALRPGRPAADAISAALEPGDVSCVVAGTSRPTHLNELARAVA
jgi:aryl-alcohol dehydrogenase-like predicted oxidoreductase